MLHTISWKNILVSWLLKNAFTLTKHGHWSLMQLDLIKWEIVHYHGYIDRKACMHHLSCRITRIKCDVISLNQMWCDLFLYSVKATVRKLKRRNEWSYMHLWNEEWNQRLSRLCKQLETPNQWFVIDWLRCVKWTWRVCSGFLQRTRRQREENCRTFASGIQQNCSLLLRTVVKFLAE